MLSLLDELTGALPGAMSSLASWTAGLKHRVPEYMSIQFAERPHLHFSLQSPVGRGTKMDPN